MSNLESEKKIIAFMIMLYCRGFHKKKLMCPNCDELLQYATGRLDHCKYGNQKTSCKKCPTHCYSPEKRIAIKRVMKFAGPRMLFLKPIAVLRHLLNC